MVVVIMGVSGSGKSTLLQALTARLGWPGLEADDLHPAANVAKMARGVPLTEADRRPWLDAVAAAIGRWRLAGQSGVVACSALSRASRDRLRAAAPDCLFVYLEADLPLVEARMASRRGHFMPAALAPSQFDALESPDASEGALIVSAAEPVARLTALVTAEIARPRP